MENDTQALGLTLSMEEDAQREGLASGRVFGHAHGIWRVMTRQGEVNSRVSGLLLQQGLFPAVGDFVQLKHPDGIIVRVLPRRSAFVRLSKAKEQVIAANIDTIFICMALDRDFNLRRLERYLAVAWNSGALPVVVLTKADLCMETQTCRAEAEAVAPGVDIVITPNETEALRRYFWPGSTAAFVGSSGVGKSTLINMLAGKEILATSETRSDGKGRHTTTARSLIRVGCGTVIDTPGMRELGIESAEFSQSFADIDTLAQNCRFADCAHKEEPGCAVREAMQKGCLSEERLENWFKLRKEAAYVSLNARQIEAAKYDAMLGPGGIKKMKRIKRELQKRR